MKTNIIAVLTLAVLFAACSNSMAASDIIISSQKENVGGFYLETFSYNKSIPGPLLEANKGQTKTIRFFNNLPVKTTVHFHGIIPDNKNDGVPYITQEPINTGAYFDYNLRFPHSGLFWYHSHVDGYEQVEKGLQAPFIVREKIPVVSKENEVVYVIDDILVRNNEWYPFSTSFMHGRNGNVLLINGKEFQNDFVSSNVARLRIVNTANARNQLINFGGKQALVIGKDLEFGEPYNTTSVFIPPAGRVDLLIFGNEEEPTFLYNQLGNKNYPIAKINYENKKTAINYPQYDNFQKIIEEFESLPVKQKITMTGYMRPMHNIEWTFSNQAFPNNPLSFNLQQGKQVIELVNTQAQPHPIHFHGMKFVVLERNGIKTEDNFWYDTVHVGSFEKVKLGLVVEDNGTWIFHCHILEHADSGMVGIIEVL